MSGRLVVVAAGLVCVLCAAVPAFAGDVSVGSPAGTTPQNHQNEPSVAIDANHPSFAVAGWNDFVDWAPCPQARATQRGTCSDPADSGVGLSAVSFSFDSGKTWIQPADTGWTAADCNPTATSVLNKNSWQAPVLANNNNGQTAFEDKEQIWADNAQSSPFFGRVYICTPEFRSNGRHPGLGGNFPAPLTASVSTDGGTTW